MSQELKSHDGNPHRYEAGFTLSKQHRDELHPAARLCDQAIRPTGAHERCSTGGAEGYEQRRMNLEAKTRIACVQFASKPAPP